MSLQEQIDAFVIAWCPRDPQADDFMRQLHTLIGAARASASTSGSTDKKHPQQSTKP